MYLQIAESGKSSISYRVLELNFVVRDKFNMVLCQENDIRAKL